MHLRRVAAIATLLGALLMTSCANESPTSEATLTGIIEDVMAAADVDVDRNFIAGYARKSRDGTVACADLPEDDRWYVRQTGDILSGRQAPQRIYDGVLAYLEDNDYDITRYEPVPPAGALRYALLGTKKDLAVQISILSDGNSSIRVFAGPCSVPFAGFSDNLYRPVD